MTAREAEFYVFCYPDSQVSGWKELATLILVIDCKLQHRKLSMLRKLLIKTGNACSCICKTVLVQSCVPFVFKSEESSPESILLGLSYYHRFRFYATIGDFSSKENCVLAAVTHRYHIWKCMRRAGFSAIAGV